jgi:Skp family chaperone for outer membrane proteins
MKHLLILSLFLFFPFLNAIEISLEENKAESGTVGYVDIGLIFKKYSINSKKDFDKIILEKQNIVDDKKKELNYYRALKEKLKNEREIARMAEDFYKRMSEAVVSSSSISDTVTISSSDVNISSYTLNSSSAVISISTISVSISSVGYSANISTASLARSDNISAADIAISSVSVPVPDNVSVSSLAILSQTALNSQEEPYVFMPGMGKIPISNFKFSVSSSTVEIERAIGDVDAKISKLQSDILSLKNKFDDELSKSASKENERMLKKIYDAIDEVSKEEEVSVVVDKRNILFGRKTVDLTEKVLEKLRSER